MVFLRSGDRMEVKLPAETVSVSTRYGVLKLRPEMIASIQYQLEEQAAHQVHLVDGSSLAGLVMVDSYNLELAGAAPGQRVSLPGAALSRVQFNTNVTEPDDATPVMNLANGDALVGTLQGQLRLATTFDTIAISCGEIKRLAALKTSPSDVEVTLWDESVVAGMLSDPMLDFVSASGISVRVPASLVEEYFQPRPTPSDAVIEAIRKLVIELNADDWRVRDGAQEKLIAMGPIALTTLKQLRPAEQPEAQQRIDLIIPVLEKMGRK
jgi:hypothetical protein